ncbi:MAG TPA: YhjD/YihY/BrkB family envelope integrity protein [Acidimicrobiales bacterium]|nr:YhjD/YihY/BrkB family envelope integrity protein [Acidimicrobiales bacterium]
MGIRHRPREVAGSAEPAPPAARPAEAGEAEPSIIDILRSPPPRRSGRVAARVEAVTAWLERARRRSTVIDVLMRLKERDREAAGPVAGSAVAFRLFLFFVPLLLVLVALGGFFATFFSAEDASSTAGVGGVLAKQIETAFSQPSSTRWTALLFGLVGTLSAGRSLAKTLVLTSALSWRAPVRQKATVRVIAVVVGVMLSVALCATLVNRVIQRFGVAVSGVSLVGVAVAYAVVWMLLCLTLPRQTRDPGALLPGSALVGVSMAGLQAVTQLYIPDKISHASSLYGSIGITVVTLGWFFIVGRVAVLSMTVNAVVYERLGSVSTFVFGLPILRILPEKSPRLARFFGLDEGGSAVTVDLTRIEREPEGETPPRAVG